MSGINPTLWAIIWTVLVLAFQAGGSAVLLKIVSSKSEKYEELFTKITEELSEMVTALKGIETEQKIRHEENQRRLERLEGFIDSGGRRRKVKP